MNLPRTFRALSLLLEACRAYQLAESGLVWLKLCLERSSVRTFLMGQDEWHQRVIHHGPLFPFRPLVQLQDSNEPPIYIFYITIKIYFWLTLVIFPFCGEFDFWIWGSRSFGEAFGTEVISVGSWFWVFRWFSSIRGAFLSDHYTLYKFYIDRYILYTCSKWWPIPCKGSFEIRRCSMAVYGISDVLLFGEGAFKRSGREQSRSLFKAKFTLESAYRTLLFTQ